MQVMVNASGAQAMTSSVRGSCDDGGGRGDGSGGNCRGGGDYGDDVGGGGGGASVGGDVMTVVVVEVMAVMVGVI